jgi:phosphate-selective porin OprO/OprP
VGLRHALLSIEGTAFKWWDYRLQYEFTGAGSGVPVGGIRDAFLAWRYFEPVTFQLGSFFEPFVLTRTDSVLYQTFIERSLAEVLTPSRHLGFAAETGAAPTGITPPGIGKPDWSLKAGIFSTSPDQGCTSCAGAPGFGSSNFLAPVAGGSQYWDAAARLTYAPILTEQSLLHIGGSLRFQDPNDATAYSDNRVLQPGNTLKSEANILNFGLLGAQPLTCVAGGSLSPSTQTTQLVGGNCVKSVWNYGGEIIASYGPFSVQGEYIGIHYNRNAAEIMLTGSPGAASIDFSGYYVYGTWFLTGESRSSAYLTSANYVSPGTFGQIKIINPLSAGGWGAWELAARVSEVNLNSGGYLVQQPLGISSSIQGGSQTDFTLGLNWYPDRGVRFMLNWVDVLQLSAPYNRPALNGFRPQLFVARAQINW